MASSSIERMIEVGPAGEEPQPAAPLPAPDEIEGWIATLQGDGHGLDDTDRIDMIRALERLTCAAAGAQAALTAAFPLYPGLQQ